MGPTAGGRSPPKNLSGGYPRFPPRATDRPASLRQPGPASRCRSADVARAGRGETFDGTADPIPPDNPLPIAIPSAANHFFAR